MVRPQGTTHSWNTWDEHAHYSPDGGTIVWISSVNDFDPENWRGTMQTEYFVMGADGSNQRQLTFFNTPGHPHNELFNSAQVICADSAWNAEGDKLMISIAVAGQPQIIELLFNYPASTQTDTKK